MNKYVVLIGLPGSGKSTLSNMLVKKKKAKGVLSIGSFRELIVTLMPAKLNVIIKEDLAWELFRSSIAHLSCLCPLIINTILINLCGVNGREQKVLEELENLGSTFIKLICNEEELLKRVKNREKEPGWFPYKITYENIIRQGFRKNIKILKSDLVLKTDKETKEACYDQIIKILERKG